MEVPLEAKAAALVNPRSGIASDYLNHFYDALLMLENLAVLHREMVEDLMRWRPVSYTEYFQRSPLPASAEALRIYATLDENLRSDFAAMIELVDRTVLHCIELVASHRLPDGTVAPVAIAEISQTHAPDLHQALERTADLVNYGNAPPLERPQHMADRLMTDQKKNVG